MAFVTLTAGAIAAIIAALAAAGVATGTEAGVSDASTRNRNNSMKDWIRKQYPNLTETEVNALVSQYGDVDGGMWDISKWGDQSDWTGLRNSLNDLQKAYDELGYMPQALTLDQINEIENQARGEIDAENRQLFDLFDQTTNRSSDLMQQQLAENQQAFADYRNQVLTNDAMNQQAIAGSTRYELERSQRNAIIRGASAAQRLVANINTQLGMQSKAAQQSLDTSNALAQQLLAHRRAQAGIRYDYMNMMNQDAMNRAGVIKGSAERKNQYAQAQVGYNMDKNQYARDAWNDRVSDYFSGNSVGEGIYRRQYGSNRNNNNGGY